MYLDYNTHKNQQGDKNPMGADTGFVFDLNLTITILLVERIGNSVTKFNVFVWDKQASDALNSNRCSL